MKDSAISISIKEGSILMNCFCLDGKKRDSEKLLLWEIRKRKVQRRRADALLKKAAGI